jgi:hypothetical protein
MITFRIKGRHIPRKYGPTMVSVSVEARKNGQRKTFGTGVRVEPHHWDRRNAAVKTTHEDFLTMNMVIQQSLRKLKDIQQAVLLEGTEASLSDLENRFLDKESPRLVQYIRDCIEGEQDVAYSTQIAWLDTLKKLIEMAPRSRKCSAGSLVGNK